MSVFRSLDYSWQLFLAILKKCCRSLLVLLDNSTNVEAMLQVLNTNYTSHVYFFASFSNYESSKYHFTLIIMVMKAYVFRHDINSLILEWLKD